MLVDFDTLLMSFVQDKRGVMYFCNNNGILEYDGNYWRTIETANITMGRSIAISENEQKKLLELTNKTRLIEAVYAAIRFTLLHDKNSIQEALKE